MKKLGKYIFLMKILPWHTFCRATRGKIARWLPTEEGATSMASVLFLLPGLSPTSYLEVMQVKNNNYNSATKIYIFLIIFRLTFNNGKQFFTWRQEFIFSQIWFFLLWGRCDEQPWNNLGNDIDDQWCDQ